MLDAREIRDVFVLLWIMAVQSCRCGIPFRSLPDPDIMLCGALYHWIIIWCDFLCLEHIPAKVTHHGIKSVLSNSPQRVWPIFSCYIPELDIQYLPLDVSMLRITRTYAKYHHYLLNRIDVDRWPYLIVWRENRNRSSKTYDGGNFNSLAIFYNEVAKKIN